MKGDCAKRWALGDIDRSTRLLIGLGGILGAELLELSFSEALEGRGGMAGVDCVAAAVMVAI